MDLLDVIAIDVVREKGSNVPAKVIARALGVKTRTASSRIQALRKKGVIPKRKMKKKKPTVPLEPAEKARRAAQRDRRRLVLERQALASQASVA